MAGVIVSTTAFKYVELDDRGRACADGPRLRVSHIAIEKMKGFSAEEIQRDAYRFLSLAQVYSALAYHYEHQAEAEVDAEIDRESREADELFKGGIVAGPKVTREELDRRIREWKNKS